MSKDLCSICKKPAKQDFLPFCSKRCSDVDLGRWLKGGYVIPGRDGDAGIPANDYNPDEDPGLR
ncbi:MAG: DNA gyrase inhibitor YacG [Robiginitomaculum sp.]|nr:MAG: DNA gyrase inhibitor YacG [Robiginitomaculum sp.]